MKVEEMRGIWRGKKFKTKICPNNTRNEAIICFSFEGEAQLDVTEINAYIVWKAELYKSIKRIWERCRIQIIATTKKVKEKTESSTKQEELSHLKEEIKYIKTCLSMNGMQLHSFTSTHASI